MRKYLYLFSIFFIMFCTKVQAQEKSTMEKAILQYVNQYRVQHHLQPLAMNAAMSKEAYLHSHDMAEHKVPFGHGGFIKRIHNCFKSFNKENGPGAENVAYNYKTAKIVVDGWLHSRGHLANIRGNYNLTGIGIARDKFGKFYFTQLFMRV